MSNSWRQPAYLHKRSAVTERDGVDESVVKVTREIMPDCVLSLVGCRTVCCHLWDAGLCVVPCGMPDCVFSLVRELYPNPVGVPYLGHTWRKGQLLVSSFYSLSYLFVMSLMYGRWNSWFLFAFLTGPLSVTR